AGTTMLLSLAKLKAHGRRLGVLGEASSLARLAVRHAHSRIGPAITAGPGGGSVVGSRASNDVSGSGAGSGGPKPYSTSRRAMWGCSLLQCTKFTQTALFSVPCTYSNDLPVNIAPPRSCSK